MHKLEAAGIPLPEIYVCETKTDALPLRGTGIPYIITKMPDIDIIKIILLKTLKKRFPHIKWNEILGIKGIRRINIIVSSQKEVIDTDESAELDIETEKEDRIKATHDIADIADDYRQFSGTRNTVVYESFDASAFCDDKVASVNIEKLQALGFLPQFMDDITNAIRLNLENQMRWHECYNKKLGCCVGDVLYENAAPNLIILDISGSIPEGISGTMISLIDTLREQANAELIITGGTSMYFDRDSELPEPEWIRSHIGYGNEAIEFYKILKDKISGRHFGNVISFGDNDCPERFSWQACKTPILPGTKIDRVMHYHTWKEMKTGYALWVDDVSPGAEHVFDTSWCTVMV